MNHVAIAFAPSLATNAAGFVADWNRTPECRVVAQAELGSANAVTYDPSLLAGGLVVLGTIATSVTASLIHDLIKNILAGRQITTPTEVVEIHQPDGTRLLIVRSSGRTST